MCACAVVIKLTQRDVCMTYQDIHIRHLVEDLTRQLGRQGGNLGWRQEVCGCTTVTKFCAAHLPNSLKGFIDWFWCPKLDGERFHQISCLEGNCSQCGVAQLARHSCKALFIDKPAKWREFFRYLDPVTNKTVYREVNVPCANPSIDASQRKGTRAELMVHFMETLMKWLWFDFVGEWQMKAILRRMARPLPRALALTMDFAAVFSWCPFEESQSSYYDRVTLRILVVVVHRQWDPTDPPRQGGVSRDANGDVCDEPVCDVHYFMALGSDVQSQKWPYVQFALRQLIMHYNQQLSQPVEICDPSMDGCSGQFKSRHTLLGFSRMQELTQLDWLKLVQDDRSTATSSAFTGRSSLELKVA